MFYYWTVAQQTKMLRLLSLTALVFLYSSLHVGIMAESLTDRDIIHDVLKRLADLERRDVEQQAELEILRGQNMELEKLRETNLQLVQEIEQLHERGVQLSDRIRLLEDREVIPSQNVQQKGDIVEGDSAPSVGVHDNIPNYPQSKQESNENTGIVSTSKHESSHKDGHSRTRQVGQYKTIAFSATRGGAHAEHLGEHQPVVFERTITNIGQGYHNSTGTFTAPLSWVYVFSTTILAYSESARFDFVVNGHVYTAMYAYSTETYETLSQTIMLTLNKGDDVAIQSTNSDKFVHGGTYSTFSGFLLVADDNEAIVG